MSLENYTEIEEARVWDTICTLRQMRYAGEIAQEQTGRFDVQKILMDADRLAKSPAPYLVNLLAGEQTPTMLEDWNGARREMGTKYGEFPMIRRSPFSNPLQDIKSKLRIMSLTRPNHDNLENLTEFFILMQNIADLEFQDLFDDRLGLLAPLSTDILVASFLPAFIRKHYSQKVPQVKPALADTYLKIITFPKDELGRPVFAELDRVLAYVDLDAMGDTRKTLSTAAQLEYPGKVILTGIPSSRRYHRLYS